MFDLKTIGQFGLKAAVLAGAVAAVAGASAPAMANDKPMTYKVFNVGAAPQALREAKFDKKGGVSCGVQFDGSVAANSTNLYFTFDWNPAQNIAWSIMPTTTSSSGPELTLSNVGLQLSDSSDATYWLTISNPTSSTQSFQGRFCIL
jgi:hypothetical protein